MAEQARLFEFRMGERAPERHVVSASNRAAAELLTNWRHWPGGAMALTGPKGSGRTHLAHAWAASAAARLIGAATLDLEISGPAAAAEAFEAAEGRLAIDDADRARDDMALVRILDLARWRGGAVLLVGESDPAHWACATPDLTSRFSALPAARLEEPDEALLELVLRRLCRERFMELSDKAVTYLVTHMERTFAQAHALVAELDRTVVKGARPIATAQARKALQAVSGEGAP
ncbi:MAG: chromosomal replication initiator DnaA [Alphaproteobacteria bacterium]|nr:chromosomal replication initiator DnaA [Alphaproteobacteria bacterium]